MTSQLENDNEEIPTVKRILLLPWIGGEQYYLPVKCFSAKI